MNIFLSAWDDAALPPLALVGPEAPVDVEIRGDVEAALSDSAEDRVVVFYPDPASAVRRRIANDMMPSVAVLDWAESVKTLLKMQRAHRKRVALVSAGDFAKAPEAFSDGIFEQIGVELSVSGDDPVPSGNDLSDRDILLKMIARFALEASAEAQPLMEELEAAAIYLCDPAEHEIADTDRAMAAWSEGVNACCAAATRAAELEGVVQTTTDQIADLQKTMGQLTEAQRVAVADAADLQRVADRLKARVAELEKVVSTRTAQVQSESDRADRLEETLGTLRSEQARTAEQLSAARSDAQEKAGVASALEQQTSQLQAELVRLQEASALADEMASRLRDLQVECAKADAAQEEAVADAIRWMRVADVLGNQIIELQEAVAARISGALPAAGRSDGTAPEMVNIPDRRFRVLRSQTHELRIRALVAAGRLAVMDIGHELGLPTREA